MERATRNHGVAVAILDQWEASRARIASWTAWLLSLAGAGSVIVVVQNVGSAPCSGSSERKKGQPCHHCTVTTLA